MAVYLCVSSSVTSTTRATSRHMSAHPSCMQVPPHDSKVAARRDPFGVATTTVGFILSPVRMSAKTVCESSRDNVTYLACKQAIALQRGVASQNTRLGACGGTASTRCTYDAVARSVVKLAARHGAQVFYISIHESPDESQGATSPSSAGAFSLCSSAASHKRKNQL